MKHFQKDLDRAEINPYLSWFCAYIIKSFWTWHWKAVGYFALQMVTFYVKFLHLQHNREEEESLDIKNFNLKTFSFYFFELDFSLE
jgi:hypothetical protein